MDNLLATQFMASCIRPRRSVWSQPHRFGTLSSHRLCTFISHTVDIFIADHQKRFNVQHFSKQSNEAKKENNFSCMLAKRDERERKSKHKKNIFYKTCQHNKYPKVLLLQENLFWGSFCGGVCGDGVNCHMLHVQIKHEFLRVQRLKIKCN